MVRKSIYLGKRATVDQMTKARALCGGDPVLTAKLDNLLSKQPNDRIMQKFIDYLRDPSRHEGGFEVEPHAGLRVTTSQGRRDRTEAKRPDNLTPIFVATGFTVFFETLLVVVFHADPDIHLINYALTGFLAFGAVAVAFDADLNG